MLTLGFDLYGSSGLHVKRSLRDNLIGAALGWLEAK